MSAESRRRALFVAVLVVAALLRVGSALRPGLWVDEIFSIALATGHSLEHPAADADPGEGDFVEPAAAQPAAAWQRYLAHETPPAGFRRVLRAVRLSDTSPPLYYLLLDRWMRVAGTSDAALRLFSTACALLALPLLWSVGRALGGTCVAAIASLLFALAPAALHYATEGRMYALTWLWGLALARLTLTLGRDGMSLGRDGVSPGRMASWVVVAAAGLLTHYYFGFVVAAMVAWLALQLPRGHAWTLAVLVALVAVLVAPWYVHLPASLAAWRVTGHWLERPLTAWQIATGWFRLAGSLLNGRGVWGGSELLMWGQFALYGGLGVLILRRGPAALVTRERQMAWLWLLASVLGPLAFDLWRGTATSRVERYALPGLPAAVLALALGIDHVFRPFGVAILVGTVIAWLPAIRDIQVDPARPWEPFPSVAARLVGWTGPADVVIVDSIPSGVLGVARYLDPATPVVSWVTALERRRMPDDAEAVTAGRCRVALVTAHLMEQPAPVNAWLRSHAALRSAERLYADLVTEQTEVLLFDRCGSPVRALRTPGSSAPETP